MLRSAKGKTVGVELILKNDKILDILLHGDFFAYPPEIIDEVQNSLKNVDLACVEDVVRKVCSKGKLVGINVRDIIDVIFKAVKECK